MPVLGFVLMAALSLSFMALAIRRSVFEGRPNGTAIYLGLQTALLLAFVAMLCWQVFRMGFEMGGDVARRDARADARAAAIA